MAEKLSSSELQALRARAAQGEPLTPEEVARFVAATRQSFLSAPKPKGKKKEEKAPPTSESEIDFF